MSENDSAIEKWLFLNRLEWVPILMRFTVPPPRVGNGYMNLGAMYDRADETRWVKLRIYEKKSTVLVRKFFMAQWTYIFEAFSKVKNRAREQMFSRNLLSTSSEIGSLLRHNQFRARNTFNPVEEVNGMAVSYLGF